MDASLIRIPESMQIEHSEMRFSIQRIRHWVTACRSLVALALLADQRLFRQDRAWTVLIVRDGRAELTSVQIGEQNATGAQVLDGLRAGDEVVLFPSDQIKSGRRVTRGR